MKVQVLLSGLFLSLQVAFANDLTNFNPTLSLSPLVKVVEKAIVSVQVTIERRSPFSDFNDPFLEFFFGGQMGIPKSFKDMASGSGNIISEDGLVLTCAHVVKNFSKVQVKLIDGRVFPVKLVFIDEETDLALFKIQSSEKFSFVTLGDSDEAQIGDRVMAAGYPFGVRQTITSGILSSKGQILEGKTLLQTDAAVNPGNSGGGLFNMKGELIGVPNAIYSRTGAFHGIGFAIPSLMVKALLVQADYNDNRKSFYHGFETKGIKSEQLQALGIKDIDFAEVVSSLDEAAPAAKAGLLRNDIIVEVNQKRIASIQDLKIRLILIKENDEVNLSVYRGDEKKTITYKPIVEMNKTTETREFKNSAGLLSGLKLSEKVKESRKSVIVEEIQPGSPASQLGLQKGDIIKSINGQKMTSVGDIDKMSKDKTIEYDISLEFERNGQAVFRKRIIGKRASKNDL